MAFCFLLVPLVDLIGQLEIQGIIRDQDNKENLIYAHIYNLSQEKGTISNELGEFSINIKRHDTLRFSYLGYNDLLIAGKDFPESGIVELKIETKLINAITVVADDSYLYNYISNCQKLIIKDKSKVLSKAYLNSISYDNDVPIEFIESFHNVRVEQSSLNGIKFKNGKSVLAPNHQGNYFYNLNITQALSKYSVLNGHILFPYNPLEFSKNKLRKKYQLSLENQTDQLIVISFAPRKNESKYFTGKIWIDKQDNALLAIELHSNGQDQKLFQGVGQSRIRNINYTIKFSFQKKDKNTVLSFIKLNYDAKVETMNSFERKDEAIETLDITSQSIIHLFDHNAPFILPFFKTPAGISDYRLFTIPPQNDTIWKELQKLNQVKLTKKALAVRKDIQRRGELFKDNLFLNEMIFEQNYLRWAEKQRITLNKNEKIQNGENGNRKQEPVRKTLGATSEQLKVNVLLYLDFISTGENMVYESCTILDVFNSYNYMNQSKALNCYVNIYFDIGEIFRRRLVKRIEESDKSLDSIVRIYFETINEMNSRHRLLIKETFAGENIDKLAEWNGYILKELGINNFEQIGFE